MLRRVWQVLIGRPFPSLRPAAGTRRGESCAAIGVWPNASPELLVIRDLRIHSA